MLPFLASSATTSSPSSPRLSSTTLSMSWLFSSPVSPSWLCCNQRRMLSTFEMTDIDGPDRLSRIIVSLHPVLFWMFFVIGSSSLLRMGQKGLAAKWCFHVYTYVWVCAVTPGQRSDGREMGHQSSACAQHFQRTKKLTATTLRFAHNVHFQITSGMIFSDSSA